MKSYITIMVQLCLFLLFINSSEAGGVPKGPKRSRIANSGLLPFPRVGRSGPAIPWDLESNDIMHDDMKRTAKFMQFPRVGRANSYYPFSDGAEDVDNYNLMEKRAGGAVGGGNKNSGLWFGPRLGRLHKRSDGRVYGSSENNNVAAYAYLLELFPRQFHYAPRQSNAEDVPEEERANAANSALDMTT